MSERDTTHTPTPTADPIDASQVCYEMPTAQDEIDSREWIVIPRIIHWHSPHALPRLRFEYLAITVVLALRLEAAANNDAGALSTTLSGDARSEPWPVTHQILTQSRCRICLRYHCD